MYFNIVSNNKVQLCCNCGTMPQLQPTIRFTWMRVQQWIKVDSMTGHCCNIAKSQIIINELYVAWIDLVNSVNKKFRFKMASCTRLFTSKNIHGLIMHIKDKNFAFKKVVYSTEFMQIGFRISIMIY